jgi:hypothetical protein
MRRGTLADNNHRLFVRSYKAAAAASGKTAIQIAAATPESNTGLRPEARAARDALQRTPRFATVRCSCTARAHPPPAARAADGVVLEGQP